MEILFGIYEFVCEWLDAAYAATTVNSAGDSLGIFN